MSVGFPSPSEHLSSDIFQTTCPRCLSATEYHFNVEVSCARCSTVFTVIQDSDDVNSLSEDNNPPEEMFGKRNQDPVIYASEGEAEAEAAMAEEFISVLTEEIKMCMKNEIIRGQESILDVQVLDIEEVNPCISDEGLSTSGQKYVAKIKIMTTLVVPVTVCSEPMDERK